MEAWNNKSRRDFIRTLGVVGTGLAAGLNPVDLFAASTQQLTILHTNDTHSRLDPFPPEAGANAGKGGVGKRLELIQKIRAENSQVLLLDSGDIFQGTPYFNMFKGEPEMKAMALMKYDAATMGNHDFDAGLENFANQMKWVDFPFLTANYNFDQTPLKGLTKPFTILQKGKIRVGIFGVGIDPAGLIPDVLAGKTRYLNPIDVANEMAFELKHQKKCDLIICLSHLGFEYSDPSLISDKLLASKTKNIDLILGGHTHTLLAEPFKCLNTEGKPVLINQVGWAGLVLGRIDIQFSPLGKKQFSFSTIPVG